MKPKWLVNAMKRLRAEAEQRSIRNEHGRITHEGHPTPESVERELKQAYRRGYRDSEKDQEKEREG